jgi:hypothetical protein
MTMYHKRKSDVDAMQYNDFGSYLNIVAWYKEYSKSTLSAEEVFSFIPPLMFVITDNGCEVVERGDYIILDTFGVRVCKRNVFQELYVIGASE